MAAFFGQQNREHQHTESLAASVTKGEQRTLVVLVDEQSQSSARAFNFVRLHFNTAGTKVVFLLGTQPLDPTQTSRSLEEMQADAKMPVVEQWVQKAQEMGLAFQAQGLIVYGDVKDEIVRFCNALQADAVIVAPDETKGLIGKILGGSMSEHLVHHCQGNVIIVKHA